MKWLPERLANWQPQPLQIAGLAAAGLVVVTAGVAALMTSPWSGGTEEDASVAGSATPRASTTVRRSATRSPSPTPTEAPPQAETAGPTAERAPQTTVPTAPPQPAPAPVPARPSARVTQLFSWNGGDDQLTELVMIPGSSDEAIVATQKEAALWKVSISGAHQPILFGDLSAYVGGGGGEEGLLSVAFSPQYGIDGRVYIYYTRGSPQPTVLARFQVVNGLLDSNSRTVILEVPDFASNHNGGRIVFGHDGLLYLSTGDGGGVGDPQENGQNINSLLGKVLRLNVTGQQAYAIPGDNPFVGGDGLDEIWAYGFRNPWRVSIDNGNGDLWVGDVGQNAWEEVGRVTRGGNHGWDCYEGFAVYEANGCPGGGFVQPRAVYPHSGGRCSVTGGYVYRGNAVPSLVGWYVYADYCSGEVWAVSASTGGDPVLLADTPYSISSFAELPGGELAVLSFNGAVYRLAP